MIRGKLITLEGGEGVGKTTNLVFLRTYLEQHNISVVVTREPGGTELAEKIRELLLNNKSEAISEQAELLMMFAARAQHIQHVIEPALAHGKWVLCDRFTDATYAYQGGGRNMKVSTIEWLEHLVQGIERVRKRGVFDRFESEKIGFFENVRRAYLLQAEMNPERIKLIKANQPLADVQRAITDVVRVLLGLCSVNCPTSSRHGNQK
jgi:dTMP kinase